MTDGLTLGVSADVLGPKVSDGVARALAEVPRHVFLPEPARMTAYLDRSVPLGRRRYCPQPSVVARLLEPLGARPRNVLVVGAGSGYVCACAAALGCDVVGVESDAELLSTATRALRTLELSARVRVVRAIDDVRGASEAPLDGVVVAGALRRHPRRLLALLGSGGVLVAPTQTETGLTLYSFRRAKRGHLRRDHGPIVIEPLASEERGTC